MSTESVPITSENIYQLIWNADQAGNGVRPILHPAEPTDDDKENGYLVVEWPEAGKNHKDHNVIQKGAVIPDKGETFKKCSALFDNYELDPTVRETRTEEEKKEIDDFINAIKDTLPMKIARNYLDPEQTDEQWFDSIKEKWFTPFWDNDRSGFEHVFVGEKSGDSDGIGGYHFWYKYYLDDGLGQVSGKETIDTIDFEKTRLNVAGRNTPEVVSLKFNWDPDEESEADNEGLEKSSGSFMTGWSPEGLVAFAMARWKQKMEGRVRIVINGTQFEIRLYTECYPPSEDAKYINTFYQIFKKAGVDPVEVPPLSDFE